MSSTDPIIQELIAVYKAAKAADNLRRLAHRARPKLHTILAHLDAARSLLGEFRPADSQALGLGREAASGAYNGLGKTLRDLAPISPPEPLRPPSPRFRLAAAALQSLRARSMVHGSVVKGPLRDLVVEVLSEAGEADPESGLDRILRSVLRG